MENKENAADEFKSSLAGYNKENIRYLVRHGQATHNVTKSTEEYNTLLTDKAVADAKQLQSVYTQVLPITVVASSPLQRSIDTAVALLGIPKDRVVLDHRFREMKNNDKSNFFDAYDFYRNSNSESREESASRLREALIHTEGGSVVCGHGFGIGLLTEWLNAEHGTSYPKKMENFGVFAFYVSRAQKKHKKQRK